MYPCSKQIASLKAVTCIVLLLAIVCCLVAGSAMPPLCENRLIEELPPKFRKVCAALENSNQFAEALNAYIRKEAADDDMLVPGQTGKRTDVDHVFLRFGRRR
uniref:Myosuppressin n=1 Tax=Anopheles christyi TaxID=43041 RepID=A0A182K2G8_9DIPT